MGNFDGVHLGHKMIIEHTVDLAKKYGGETLLMTFWPHPRLILQPHLENKLKFLTLIDEKKEILETTDLDHLLIIPFTEAFSKLTYNQFIQEYLVNGINVQHLVLGFNHQFGKDREGNFENVLKLAEKYQFKAEKVDQLTLNAQVVSSSSIRRLLVEGNVEKANAFLGYPYFVDGQVGSGKRLGRTIGYPTANIQHISTKKLIPADGVYAVQVKIGDNVHQGMVNIGSRPTVNDNLVNKSIEVHILDFSNDIYSQRLRLFFIDRIRDEKKFSGLEELKSQLIQDEQKARKLIEQKKFNSIIV
jgi:riboflavin kinase/FMN adenylyltransferase